MEISEFGVWSLLPAVLAIGLALVTRQVLISLFCGIWAGAWLLAGGDFAALGAGFLQAMDSYILRAIAPKDGSGDHATIMLFTLTTGCMIGIITRNGGISGIVEWMARHVSTPKQAQFASLGTGLGMFFDDYASMLVTGNTMRSLTDRCRVSREKLAYIVDTTAAPIASTAVVTTWIGFQVSLIDEAMKPLGDIPMGAYELMLSSLPYSFYSVLSIVFIVMLVGSGRDFGPMLAAERLARQAVPEAEGMGANQTLGKARNALIPLLVLVASIIGGLIVTGWQEEWGGIREVLGNADPFKAMLWASLLSLTSAILVTKLSSKATLSEIMEWMDSGLMPMLGAIMVLTLAWAIAGVNADLGTAPYLVGQLQENLAPQMLPAVVFLLASAIAFATGTSWGVMAILVPLVLPLAWGSLEAAGMGSAEYYPILYAAIASTLTGAVLGDHCSPISDTTILSSIASGCDHIQHVRTQLPYAMLIGVVSLGVALVPVGYGLPWWAAGLLCCAVLWGVVKLFGKPVSASV